MNEFTQAIVLVLDYWRKDCGGQRRSLQKDCRWDKTCQYGRIDVWQVHEWGRQNFKFSSEFKKRDFRESVMPVVLAEKKLIQGRGLKLKQLTTSNRFVLRLFSNMPCAWIANNWNQNGKIFSASTSSMEAGWTATKMAPWSTGQLGRSVTNLYFIMYHKFWFPCTLLKCL